MAKIEIDLSDFPTYDIIDYLENKGYCVIGTEEDAANYLEDRGWYVSEFVDSDKISNINSCELVDELEARGFTILETNNSNPVESIVQYHRCGDPRWEKLALEYLYTLANKVV